MRKLDFQSSLDLRIADKDFWPCSILLKVASLANDNSSFWDVNLLQ
jgi:hypothetical protein